MTSVSSTTRAQPSRPEPSRQAAGAKAAPDDVRAMTEAFAKARQTMIPLKETQGKPATAGKASLTNKLAADTRDGFASAVEAKADEMARQGDLTLRERDSEGQHGQGFGQSALPVPIVPVAVPMASAPHVDPGGFAQMLADLWTRENGKGAREVQVRFGADTWPATGARLIRAASGALDITLQVGDRGRAYGDRLPGLETSLAGAGITLGALAIEDDG